MRAAAFIALFALACATPKPAIPAEKLYFAVEVRKDGRLVGKPKLLGESGKAIRVERRQPGAAEADYRLVIVPAPDGEAFKVKLDVALPDASGSSDLALLHGQERKVRLGARGDLEVKLLLMKVDSPEFRALMDLSEASRSAPTSI